MRRLSWIACAAALSLLAVVLPAQASTDVGVRVPSGPSSVPGGECDGFLDIDCDQYDESCNADFTICNHVFVQHCLVYHGYLDFTEPDLSGLGVCEEHPFS